MATDDIQKRNSDYINNLGNNLEFYLHYLTTMAKFHKYPAEDLASLAIEAPQNFSAVASPEVWKKYFHRSIGKNSRGINIMRDGKKVTVYDVSETLPPDKISLWEYNDNLHKRFLDSVIQNDSTTPEKIQKIAENLIAQTELNDSDKKFATLSTAIVILERLNQSQNNSEEFRKPIENLRRQLANLDFEGRNYKILTDTIQRNSQKVLDAFQKSVQIFSDDVMDLEYNFPDLSLPENNPLLKTLGIIEVAETQQAAEEKNSDVEIKLNIEQENLFSEVQKETGTDLIEDLLKDATIEPVTYKNENGEIYHVHYPDGFSVIYEGTDYKKGAYKEGFGRTEKSFKTFNEAFRYVQNHKNDTDKDFLQNDNFNCYYKITKNIPDKLTLDPTLYVYNFKTQEEVYFDEKIKEFIQTEQKKVVEDIKNIVVPEENFIDLTAESAEPVAKKINTPYEIAFNEMSETLEIYHRGKIDIDEAVKSAEISMQKFFNSSMILNGSEADLIRQMMSIFNDEKRKSEEKFQTDLENTSKIVDTVEILKQDKFEVGTFTHTRTAEKIPSARLTQKVDRDEYLQLNSLAKKHGGSYSRFAKQFLFDTEENRDAFISATVKNFGNISEQVEEQISTNKNYISSESREEFLEIANPEQIQNSIKNIQNIDIHLSNIMEDGA